jgi:hypothetical protein
MGTGDEQPQLLRDVVQRKFRERIGIQSHDHGHRQIYAEYDRTQGGGQHLQRSGHQPAEHADRHTAGHRFAVKMPEIVVLQGRAEDTKVTILADALVTRQVFAEKLARHGCDEYYSR